MRTPEGGGTFQQSRPFTSFNSRKQSSSFKSQNKLLKRKLVHKQWGEINTSIPLIWLVFCFVFVSPVLFHGAPLSHQEGSLGVIQGIKLIIGLIRRICILMRHSVTRPLRLKCYPSARWPDWETRPPLWIVLSSETHYPISMMQYVSKTTVPTTWEGNWLCFAKKRSAFYRLFWVSWANCNIFKFKLFIWDVFKLDWKMKS